jgi:hypothetical protein
VDAFGTVKTEADEGYGDRGFVRWWCVRPIRGETKPATQKEVRIAAGERVRFCGLPATVDRTYPDCGAHLTVDGGDRVYVYPDLIQYVTNL